MDARDIDWVPTLSALTVDASLNLLDSVVLILVDVHAPILSVELKRPSAPGIPRAVRIAMAR